MFDEVEFLAAQDGLDLVARVGASGEEQFELASVEQPDTKLDVTADQTVEPTAGEEFPRQVVEGDGAPGGEFGDGFRVSSIWV